MTSLGSTTKHYEALRKHYESTWNLSRLKNHALKTYVQKTEFESTMCQFQPVEVIEVTSHCEWSDNVQSSSEMMVGPCI